MPDKILIVEDEERIARIAAVGGAGEIRRRLGREVRLPGEVPDVHIPIVGAALPRSGRAAPTRVRWAPAATG